MVERLADGQRVTLGADKAYETADFVAEIRRLGFTPHASQNTNGRRSAIDRRTTRHAGCAISVRVRKRMRKCPAGSHSGDHERSICSIMNTGSGDHEHALVIS